MLSIMSVVPPDTAKENFHGLVAKLLDAVKRCQIRYGGRTELATESDECVSQLCAQFEAVLQHGLRRPTPNAISSAQPLPPREITGGGASGGVVPSTTARLNVRDVMMSLNLGFKPADDYPAFWHVVREFLNRHEQERYLMLSQLSSDVGRGRAWLRSALNEHSLERYMHLLLEDGEQLARYYDESAFMRNQETSAMLPNMAAGLGSILFAININNAELNDVTSKLSATMASSASASIGVATSSEPRPVIPGPTGSTMVERRKKKRVPAQIVSLDGDDSLDEFSIGQAAAFCQSAPATCHTSPADTAAKHFVLPRPFGLGMLPPSSLTSPAPLGNDTASAITVRSPGGDAESDLEECSSPDEPRSPLASCGDALGGGPAGQERYRFESPANLSRFGSGGARQIDSAGSGASASVVTGSLPIDSVLAAKSRIQHFFQGFESRRVPSTFEDDTRSPLTPVNNASVGELFPVNNNDEVQSEDSISIPSYSEDTENAAVALALAQKALRNTTNLGEASERESNSSVTDPANTRQLDGIQPGDLRQALVTIMLKKDDLEEQNRSLKGLLDQEIEMSAGLRVENDELHTHHKDKVDKLLTKLQTLTRENELLKHQLRKYVGAVQMLKRDGTQTHEAIGNLGRDGQCTVPEGRPFLDYRLEAGEYEKKLIQVAEMHGELMEFNDRLHRLLSQKEMTVRRLREELVDLRGPLPDDTLTSDDDISITSDYDNSSMTAAARSLINVWIPSVFLTGKASDIHHVYQVYIRIRDDEWNVYRRYAQFYCLHKELKKKDPIISTFEFPPKKVLGNKDAKFVEERRKRLQHYLRCVVNLMLQNNGDLAGNPDKETLIALLPFFGEFANQPNNRRVRQRRAQSLFSRGSSQSSDLPATSGHYTGL